MALLFHRDFVPRILSEEKVETRRQWDRWKVKAGKVYQAKISTQLMTPQYFARVHILKTFEQVLGTITIDQIHDEGFSSVESFRRTWTEIYGEWDPQMVIKAVRFRVVEVPDAYIRQWKPDPGRWSRECPELSVRLGASQNNISFKSKGDG